jgi:hypothetical protein
MFDQFNPVTNQRYHSYKQAARRSKREFNITLEEFRKIVILPCVFCGSLGDPRKTRPYRNAVVFNGIDRIDSDKGYTLDNIQPCCSQCNYSKSDYSELEFLSHIRRIVNFQLEKNSRWLEDTT